MTTLPNELLVHILKNVSTNDLNRTRLVDRRLARAATSVRNTRTKPRYTLTVFCDADTDETRVRLQRRWRSGAETEALASFDLDTFHLIDVDVIELEGLRGGSEDALKFILNAIENTGAFSTVSELRLTKMSIPDSCTTNLLTFFKVIVPQCSHVFVRDSLLPVAIPADTVGISNRLRTFKWTDSVATNGEAEMNEEIIQLISTKLGVEVTTVELMDAPTTSVVALFQQWMTMTKPSLFSLNILGRNQEWQSNLLAECVRLGHTHFMGEFEYPGAGCAHVKIIAGRDACMILPVLDVPAKTPNMPHVQARWFRDR
ncbi:hypothetical protein PFISCL1PPCAC_26592 [Pristionchus fissidentatus]|uniref:F-box domain-containing protein n=1 Tax=Pristionchus fissidentatus TaxID=1538716 RepID=A0AAV5WXD3_9BILA|nr:hypothetical protein PFISCL1PPCAC_26592 [Pristionchus fissidentatus]